MRALLLFSTLVLHWAVQTAAQAPCAPSCDQHEEGDKVADPTNCLRYYYCSDPLGDNVMVPSDKPLTCPSGTYFNANTFVLECEGIPANEDYCVNLCNPCVLECTQPGTLIPDPMNCNNYQVCLDDLTAILTSCPDEAPYFDYKLSMCSTSDAYCYDQCDRCEVYCTQHGKVPNPHDCRGYYLCDPPTLAPFTCQDNMVFNPASLVCEAAENCTNICNEM